jgi:hypothetical protein
MGGIGTQHWRFATRPASRFCVTSVSRISLSNEPLLDDCGRFPGSTHRGKTTRLGDVRGCHWRIHDSSSDRRTNAFLLAVVLGRQNVFLDRHILDDNQCRYGQRHQVACCSSQSGSSSVGCSWWCPGRDSNPHALRPGILSPVRLPISPPGRRTIIACFDATVASLHISRRRYRMRRVCETNQLARKTFGYCLARTD